MSCGSKSLNLAWSGRGVVTPYSSPGVGAEGRLSGLEGLSYVLELKYEVWFCRPYGLACA